MHWRLSNLNACKVVSQLGSLWADNNCKIDMLDLQSLTLQGGAHSHTSRVYKSYTLCNIK